MKTFASNSKSKVLTSVLLAFCLNFCYVQLQNRRMQQTWIMHDNPAFFITLMQHSRTG